ncbi:MAG: hypothetical protein IJX11_00710 [Bacteroidales bacterium]|nr:hypothetical protein [Bacteroidales bacterium]
MDKYGEKYSGDSKFVADCRQLQSMYRVEVNEAIRPYKGRDGKTHYYGNYIESGEQSGNNFLTEYAFSYAKYRVENKKEYETIESDRLFNNLLSSQPMAFNLFCPLREMLEKSPEAATAAIKAALPMYPIHSVTSVDLEFIPEDYAELSGDKSAMDAIIRFVNGSDKEGFIGIETKYSENLGTNVALEKGTNKPRAKSLETVRRLQCFKPDIEERITEGQIRLTQIYRNFLLSESYAGKYGLDSYSIIMAPARHPSTGKEVDSLRNELREEYKNKINSISLEDFV